MPEKPKWPVVAALLLIVLLAAWLRWTSLGDSLWIDEHHTAWIVAQDLDDVAPRAMIGNQSPLAYWPFWGYIQLAGLSEFTLRLPFFLSSLIVVALVYGLIWSWTRSLLGAITAGVLVAIYDNSIYYGVESRIYAAVQLAGLCHLLLFASLLYRPTWWRRVVWVVLGALLLHLHYTAGLLLAAECVAYGLIFLLEREHRPRYGWLSLTIDCTLMVLPLLPVMSHIAAIAGRRKNWSLVIAHQTNPLTLFFLIPIAKVLLLPAILLAIFRGQETTESGTTETTAPPRWLLWIGLAWMFVPPTAVWLASFLELASMFQVRYVIVALVAPMVFAGFMVAAAPRRWQQVVLMTVTIACALVLNSHWREPVLARSPAIDRHEPWRAAVAELNQRLANSDKPIFVYSGFIECEMLTDDNTDDPLLREFCYLPVRTCYWLDCDESRLHNLRYINPGKLSTFNAAAASQRGGWFLLRAADIPSFERAVEASLRARGVTGKLIWQSWQKQQLGLLELSIEPTAEP